MTPDQAFPGERERLEAIRDCELIIEDLQRKQDAFNRKASACLMGHRLGLPSRLFKALEVVMYDSNVRRRKMAAGLIQAWARSG